MQNDFLIHSAQKIETDLSPFRWRAGRIGQEAHRLLALPSFGGTIIAVFSKSIYLSGRNGEIFWIVKEGLPMHRRSISTLFQAHSLRPGQSFWVSGSSLWLGRTKVIDLDQAEVWIPFKIKSEEAGSLMMVNERVSELLSNFPRPIPDSGFGPAIPMISAIAGGREPETMSTDPFFALALHPIVAITKACLCEDIVRMTQAGRELIGLGSGLTPSGDDFLGGLLFALYFLKRIFPKDFFQDDQPMVDLMDWSLNQTHPISHTILSDLSSGHGPEPLYDILHFLLSGKDSDKIHCNIDRLCGIGHTSGWDILAGLLAGMLLVRGRVNRQGQEAKA